MFFIASFDPKLSFAIVEKSMVYVRSCVSAHGLSSFVALKTEANDHAIGFYRSVEVNACLTLHRLEVKEVHVRNIGEYTDNINLFRC